MKNVLRILIISSSLFVGCNKDSKPKSEDKFQTLLKSAKTPTDAQKNEITQAFKSK